ncbi:MAG TPA: IPT/TIG domain-containing protein [Planctomycetota bacterium]|nr:IPT/TIG domain-containing protein [Planctomycetota bacterium]
MGVDMSSFTWRRAGALVPFLLLAACGGGGGGGGGGPATFTVTAINPAVSVDLFGGDLVTITGTNFATAGVQNITFGGAAGTNRTIISETELTVVTPAAPGLQAGAVDVVLISSFGGTLQVPDGYTYANSAPNPQTIAPTTFSPTGAEPFTISGTTLGPLGGQVTVVFHGIGSVTADVSANGTQVTGRAPVAPGVPPIGAITVTLDTGSAQVDVPTTVGYTYSSPFAVVGAPFQTAGNASQPVRLADGYAVLCTAGANGTWGNADDEIRIVTGPPNAITIGSVSPRGSPGAQVGYLSATSSIPAVLGPDTFCVYSVGSAGAGFFVVTNARTSPVADFIIYPQMNVAPIAAIGPARVAFVSSGVDNVFGPFGAPPANQGDELVVGDLSLAAVPVTMAPLLVPAAPFADTSVTGLGNFSIPFSPDGDTVFVMGAGPDAVRWNGDDTVLAHVMSTGTTSALFPARFLIGRPIAFSTSLLAGPGVGPNGLAGGGDDALEVFTYTGGAWTGTPYLLGQTVNTAAAVVTYARVGNGIAVALAAPNALRLYTNPATGAATTLPFNGTPLLAPFGNGGLMAFGPGPNLVPATGNDDEALHINATISSIDPFSIIPNLIQNVAPLSDGNRMFAVSPGPDAAFLTGDDTLEIYQSLALGQAGSACQLPLAAMPTAPVNGALPFVPIGPGWGLLQSAGIDGAFGNIDDQLILVQY